VENGLTLHTVACEPRTMDNRGQRYVKELRFHHTPLHLVLIYASDETKEYSSRNATVTSVCIGICMDSSEANTHCGTCHMPVCIWLLVDVSFIIFGWFIVNSDSELPRFIYSSTLAYIVDANPGRSTAAVASNSSFRGISGLIASEIAAPLQDAIGDGGLYSMWAGLLFIVICMIWLVIIKGRAWREEAEAVERVQRANDTPTPPPETADETIPTAAPVSAEVHASTNERCSPVPPTLAKSHR